MDIGSKKKWLVGFAVLVLVQSCGNDGTSEFQDSEAAEIERIFQQDRARVLTQLATEVIPQGYESLEESLAELEAATIEFCGLPGEAYFSDVKNVWKSAKTTHAYTEAFEFGDPVTALDGSGNQSRARRMYIRSLNEDQMIARLDVLFAGTESITELSVSEENITIQGLQALEYVLFDSTSDLDQFFGSEEADRRCDYLVAASENLHTIAENILFDWLPTGGDFASEVFNAGEGSQIYADRETVLDDIFSVSNSLIQQMRDDKLGDVLDTAEPTSAESWRSRNSFSNFQANYEGLFAVYTGGDGFGADNFISVTTAEPIGADNIEVTYDDVGAALQFLIQPFSQAVITDVGRARMTLLHSATEALAENIEQRVFTAVTGNSSDFNFNDGD